jgi:hypothetical protein
LIAPVLRPERIEKVQPLSRLCGMRLVGERHAGLVEKTWRVLIQITRNQIEQAVANG